MHGQVERVPRQTQVLLARGASEHQGSRPLHRPLPAPSRLRTCTWTSQSTTSARISGVTVRGRALWGNARHTCGQARTASVSTPVPWLPSRAPALGAPVSSHQLDVTSATYKLASNVSSDYTPLARPHLEPWTLFWTPHFPALQSSPQGHRTSLLGIFCWVPRLQS